MTTLRVILEIDDRRVLDVEGSSVASPEIDVREAYRRLGRSALLQLIVDGRSVAVMGGGRPGPTDPWSAPASDWDGGDYGPSTPL